MDKVKVAAVQFPLGDSLSEEFFFKKMAIYLEVATGADLVVFPELLTTERITPSLTKPYKQQLRNLAQNFTPKYIQWLQKEAVARGMHILGGTTPRIEHGQVVNSAILALPTGKILIQDKIYLTPDEKLWDFSPGTELNIFSTDLGKIVITTCFDSEFPEISQLLAAEQPELILIPSWTSSLSGLNRVDWSARARAVEHHAYVIKTGTVPKNSLDNPDHFGIASIIFPQDSGFTSKVIEGVLNQSQIVWGELDLTLLRTSRQNSGYYPAKEQAHRQEPIKIRRN